MLLAAGEGTRLRPLTLDRPKPMLPIAGRPVMEWILLWLRHHGVDTVAINLCYKPEAVIEHFGDGQALGMRLIYSVEEAILGTAGGLKRVESLFDGPFVVAYGDVLTDLDLRSLAEFHCAQTREPHVTLSLYHAPNPWDCGIVAFDGSHRVTRFVEKPPREEIFSDNANAGVLIMDPEVLSSIPPDSFHDISNDLLPDLLRRGFPIFAKPPDDSVYLLDIGSHEKYRQAQEEWPIPAARAWLEVPS
jgi:Nucleoside-diphosphate-sugar pyrophosphorylase involved in lipopolysaccharide biosynthesis/translation initiation factor 2B, gamma/epsilon subunits (eIF-2Bgamma/eIF-2Bepsilon)